MQPRAFIRQIEVRFMARFSIVILCFLLCFSGAEGGFVKYGNKSTSTPLALVRGKAKKHRSRTGARKRKNRPSRTGARNPNLEWEKALRDGALGVVIYPNSQLNQIEKAQLLAGYSDAEIRTALAVRFLEIWTSEELQAELAARAARAKRD